MKKIFAALISLLFFPHVALAEASRLTIPHPADAVIASVQYAEILLKIKKSCNGTIFAESIGSSYDSATDKTKVMIEFTTFAKYKNQKIASLEVILGTEVTDVPLSIQKINLVPAKNSCIKAN